MGNKKIRIWFLIAIAIFVFGVILGPAIARNIWWMPDEDRGSFQLKILRAKEIRAPQAPNNPAVTIYSPTLSGTVTATGAAVTGGTFNSSTIASPTITGTAAFANAPAVKNLLTNAKLAIWTSGSTRDGVSADSAPDGWTVYDKTAIGVTRYGQSDSNLIATGATVYGELGYAMYVQSVETINAQADEIAFNSGVSNQAWWYQRFRGKQILWGAMVYTDPGTTGATDFIRPYIITSTTTRTTAGVSAFATYSSDYAGGGWSFLSATTTVPVGATALEVGFELKNQAALTGDSAFILGPVLLSGTTVSTSPVSGPETIFFTKTLDIFGSGGSTFGVGTGSLDLSANNGWGGKIPDDVSAIYATVIVSQAYPNALCLYGDDALGGVSFYGVASGTSPQATTAWIPVSASGTINNSATAASSGASLFVHGAVVR